MPESGVVCKAAIIPARLPFLAPWGELCIALLPRRSGPKQWGQDYALVRKARGRIAAELFFQFPTGLLERAFLRVGA